MDYTPNSHRYKEEQAEKKKVEKVISGTAKRKQKSAWLQKDKKGNYQKRGI